MELPHIPVPQAVQRAVASALELHRTHALPAEQEVSGVAVAERIVSGSVPVEDVGALARFFQVNDRHYGTRLQAAKSPRTDGLCRSWALRGGEHGRVWADRQNAALVREGVLPQDPYAALMAALPEEVYARFAVGAWRWEYGLDSLEKAARFYEDYHCATGRILDLHAAFGPSGPAVATAIMRRVHGEDPLEAAKRALRFECAEYRLAAQVDLDDMRRSGQLDENIKPFILTGSDPKLAAKIVWPVMVAYVILAAERPELLVDLHAGVKKPPTLSQDPLSLIQYCDAVRVFITYFHPKGVRAVDTAGTDFEDLPSQLESLMVKAHLGHKIIPTAAQKVLGAARRWTAANKIAGSLFHVYNADWKKGNWQNILDALPEDADVRGPFQKFVTHSPVPVEGVKLQQTLSDKKQLAAIAKLLGVEPEELDQRKIGQTVFGKAAENLGTPAGIYSVVRKGAAERTLLGCFMQPHGLVFVTQNGTSLSTVPVDIWLDDLMNGKLVVTKAHKDMKMGYAAVQAVPKSGALGTPSNIGGDAPPAITKDAAKDPASNPPSSKVRSPAPKPIGQVTQDPNVHPAPPAPPEPFGFDLDEVIEIDHAFYWIRVVYKDSYRVTDLMLPASGTPSAGHLLKKAKVDGTAKSRGKFSDASSLTPFITIGAYFDIANKLTSYVTMSPTLMVGAQFDDGRVICALWEAEDAQGKTFPIVALFDGDLAIKVLPPVATMQVASSYAPTDPKPESNLSEDANELSGTQQAFDWLAAKGWTPATESSAPVAKLALAGVYGYGSANKTRTILGYGKDTAGAFIYVIRTETGKVNWKSLAGGKDYAPLLSMDSVVQSELLPIPTTPGTKFPKLNYRLSNRAREIATEGKFVYHPSPKDAPFRVGVPLMTSTGSMVRIVGWAQTFAGQLLEAVLDQDGGFGVVSMGALKQLTRVYEHETLIAASGEAVFGKAANAAKVSVVNSYHQSQMIALPCDPPEGWQDPAPLIEIPIEKSAVGKHVSAGVLAVFPAGTKLSSGSGLFVSQSATVVLCHPAGAYGGYSLAIPKGTVDKGESLLKAAVREFFEETGMTVKPVGVLGDFNASTSMVRLYVGYVTGGNPHAKPANDEVDAVTLKPLDDLPNKGFQSASWWSELVPSGGSSWQQDAISKLADWMLVNGIPQSYVGMGVAVAHSQVTHPGDVPVAAVSSAPSSGTLVVSDPTEDVWKALLFKAPFPVTTAMIVALQSKVKSGLAADPKEFNCAKSRSVGPSFGQVFETSTGTPYTAAGYVSWLGVDGSYYHYLLGLSGAGLVEALPVEAAGAPNLQASAIDTQSMASSDPWYSHPDPSVMARMKLIFDADGKLEAAKINMSTFKMNWLKEAGVPYYAVASTKILRELAGLFVPGALSEAQKDSVINCLKSRMLATHSGKKTASTATVTAANGVSAPSGTVPVAPPKPVVHLDPTLIPAAVLAAINNPEGVKFTPVQDSTLVASSKPTQVVRDANHNKFFVKWRKGAAFQAEIDHAASVLMARVKGNVLPVGVMNYDGQRASIQPFFDQATKVPASPDNLSDANKAELLSQHAVDMFLGDHDGHGGNWIQVGSKIIGVDRGQSLKFILQGQDDSLDPSWHAPGNLGDGYAKRLLLDWSSGKATIPTSAFAAMRATIDSIRTEFAKGSFAATLDPVFAAMSSTPAFAKAVLAKLDSRRESYLKDWTTVLKKLRKDFSWPGAAGGLVLDFEPLRSTPAELKFTKREETTIQEAVKAGWQGKSLRIDGPWVENQEVMCRAVLWEDTPGVKVPATLIHFRLTKAAGLRAVHALLASGVVEVTAGVGGPQRLAVDKANSLYEKLFAAVKTINFHLTGAKPDGIPNQTTVETALALQPMLKQILDETKNAKGVYAPTNEPNEAVNAMADQYLGYVGTINYWNENAKNLIGQHSPVFTEFVYEEPEGAKVPKPKKSFQAKLKNQGASYPNITTDTGQIIVRNLHKPVVNSSQVSQFVIEDSKSGAKVFFNPTAQSGDIKAGVQGVKGLCWGVIPGAPSAPVVAHVLKLFGEATSVPMAAASDKDQRVLYLAKQAAALQGGGSFTPTVDGTALVEPDLALAMMQYESGLADVAAEMLTAIVAAKTNKTTAEIEKLATANVAGAHDARGAGFYRHNRIGLTVADLRKVLGNTTRVAHALLGHTSTIQFIKDVSVNGALLSNEIKPFYGVVKDGASPSSDFSQGGSQSIFCCLRKGSSHARHLYFDLSLALRLDAYMVGTGDSFGNVHTARYTQPEHWKVGDGYISSSSSGQFCVRHDIDLQAYLVEARCANEDEAQQCIALVKKLGWSFRFGSPEKIFTA